VAWPTLRLPHSGRGGGTLARVLDAGTAPVALLPREFFARPSLEVAPQLLGTVLAHQTPDGLVAVMLTEVEAYEGNTDPASHSYRGRTARNAVMFGPPGHTYVYFTYGMHFCVNLVCLREGTASAVLLRAGRVVEGVALASARRPAAASERDLARGPARLCQALDITRAQNGLDACDPASPLQMWPPPAGWAPAPADAAAGVAASVVGATSRAGPAAAGAATPAVTATPAPPSTVTSGDAATPGDGAVRADVTATPLGAAAAASQVPEGPLGPGISRGPRVGVSAAGDRPWRFWLTADPTVSTYRAHTPRRPRRAADR
jgi:DNA-3-methyladenine glycosylase